MKKTRKKYTLGFKILAASMSIHCERVLDVAQNLNISIDKLQHWKKLYKDGKFAAKKPFISALDQKELLKIGKQIKEL
ncbi:MULTISPECIES: transposase [Flavobacterium]|uniref:Helix-turn-helix domain containing protein n=1 Tax=Flavobacterium lipolyticum TaxID=2893754 RepID=A0ABS8M8Q1_9FLAO|nr:transposase [Flavobacterium sp. F-126]MCC9020702.1 helix-turn-helix domain containing protein [Flavobacterium sp. F-126]